MEDRQAYDTDLTDAEWNRLEPLVPAPKPGGRPPKHTRREIVNGICYAIRSGGAWKLLPHDPANVLRRKQGRRRLQEQRWRRSWQAVNSGIDDLTVESLAMDPGNPAVLYACGPNGVYKTFTRAEVQSASISAPY
jgi:hypothetical protein